MLRKRRGLCPPTYIRPHDAKQPVKMTKSVGYSAPHGAVAILAFAETLPKRAENLRGFFDYNAAAADIMRCKEIIERLAQFEPDIEVEPGEN